MSRSGRIPGGIPGRIALGLLGLLGLLLACAVVAAKMPKLKDAYLPELDELQRWHEEKARLGPTLAGGPSWQAYLKWLEREFGKRGLTDIGRDEITYTRWFTSDDPADGQWSLAVDGHPVTVASYWAYSGSTDASGVTAPLLFYDRDHPPADIAGKIVVFDVPKIPNPPPPGFKAPSNELDTASRRYRKSIAMDQWFQSNYPARSGRFGEILRNGHAAGGLVIFDMKPGRARGLYTFPLPDREPVGVPALYLDRVAGAGVREAAKAGRSATLKLLAHEETATPYFLAGYLPGRNYGKPDDEIVLLVSHTDGPNLSRENGALGILAIVGYFNQIPQDERRRTLLVLLDPQHDMPGPPLADWYQRHADIARHIAGSVGVEQLGQREYAEDGDDFQLTDRPEPTLIFVQDNKELLRAAIEAVTAEQLPRTQVRVPARGQGQWAGPGEVAVRRNIPGYAISTEMTAYWSTVPGIESFDRELCYQQIAVLVRLTRELMITDLAEIATETK